MNLLIPAQVLVALAAAQPNAAAPHVTKVAVLELEAGYGGDPQLAHALTSLTTTELRRRKTLSVTSQQDIKNLLGFRRQSELLGCSNTSCLSEIAGALGVDQLVTGSLGRVGGSYLLDLRAVDAKKAQVLREASRRLRTTDPESLLDAIGELAQELYPEADLGAVPASAAPVVTVAMSPAHHPNRTGPIIAGVAGAVIAFVGAALWLDAAAAGQKQPDGTYGITYAQALQRNREATAGVAIFIPGIVIGAGGLAWGIAQ